MKTTIKTRPLHRNLAALLAFLAASLLATTAHPQTPAAPAPVKLASAEANAFVAEFGPFVDEYERLANEAAQTGNIAKFKAFDDSPASMSLMMKSRSIGKTLTGDDEVNFRKYMSDQMRRLFAANATAKKATSAGIRFDSAAANAYARELEASVAKIVSLAQEASQTNDVTKFNAYVQSSEAVALKAKGEEIKKSLTGEDVQRFQKYMLDQAAPLLIAYGIIQKISSGNAQAPAGSTNLAGAPAPKTSAAAASPASSSFARSRAWSEAFRQLGAVGNDVTPDATATIPGDPGRPTFPQNKDADELTENIARLVSRYLNLFESGDPNALAKFRDPATGFMGEIIKLGAHERRVRPTLPDNYQDAVIEYLNDQRARLAAALAKASAPAASPSGPSTSSPATGAPSFTKPKPPTPVFTNPNLTAFVKELDTYVEGVVAAASEALKSGDYKKFRRYFNSVGDGIVGKRYTVSKSASKDEGTRLAAYYSAQMTRRDDAYIAVEKASKNASR